MDKPKEEPKENKLTKDELVLISNVLFINRFTGQEWEQTIKPLVNKLAQMVDSLTK